MYTNDYADIAAGAAAGIVSALVILLFAAVIRGIINGIMCNRLAAKKGYSGYFFTGFFFGSMGLLYEVGLPDLNEQKDLRAALRKMAGMSDRLAQFEQK